MRSGVVWKFRIARLLCLGAVVSTGGLRAEMAVKHAKAPLARKRKPAAVSPRVAEIPVGSLMTIIASPRPLPPPDKIYLQYFSATDPTIERQYLDRWAYQEMQIPYAATEWQHEHLSIGTRDVYGRAPYEGDVRRDFANHVLRIRLDSAIREYFKGTAGAKKVAKAEQTMRQIKSMPVRVSNKPGAGTFQFGYDVLSDASKVEYSQYNFNAGIYHPHLLSALTGTARFNELTVRLGVALAPGLPNAGIAYQPATTVLEMALSKAVSRRVSTRLMQITSSRPDIAPPSEYRVEVSYQF